MKSSRQFSKRLFLTSDKPLYVNFGSAPLLAETGFATGAPPGMVVSPVSGQNGGTCAEDSGPLGSKIERQPRNQGRRPDAQAALPELTGGIASDDLCGNPLNR